MRTDSIEGYSTSFRRLRAGRLWGLLLVVLLAGVVRADGPDPSRVLFVGNSFTYYNNSLHNHYRALVDDAWPNSENRARAMTIAGGRLYEHHGLAKLLRDADWQVVVLQGHSLEAIDDEARFRKAAARHAKSIRRHGGRPVLFMTWAYTDRPEMSAPIAEAYTTLGKDIDATVVPVGLAFERVTKERPDIALRTDDRRHPTLAGTYLAACVFFAALQDRSPEPLDYDAGLDADTAAYLRGAAQLTVAAFDAG